MRSWTSATPTTFGSSRTTATGWDPSTRAYRGGRAETRRTGSFGHLATSSFYPAHQMTTGEGGAVYTSDEELATIAESFRDWGRDCYCKPGRSNTCGKRFGWCLGTLPEGYDHKYTYSHFGYNLKMTDMQAAVGVGPAEEASLLRRGATVEKLRLPPPDGSAPFGEVLRLPEPTPHATPSWFGFLAVVRPGTSVTRDSAWSEPSSRARVQTRMLFAGNLVRQPCFDEMRAAGTGFRQIGDLPNTDRLMNDAFWFGVCSGHDRRPTWTTSARPSRQHLIRKRVHPGREPARARTLPYAPPADEWPTLRTEAELSDLRKRDGAGPRSRRESPRSYPTLSSLPSRGSRTTLRTCAVLRSDSFFDHRGTATTSSPSLVRALPTRQRIPDRPPPLGTVVLTQRE